MDEISVRAHAAGAGQPMVQDKHILGLSAVFVPAVPLASRQPRFPLTCVLLLPLLPTPSAHCTLLYRRPLLSVFLTAPMQSLPRPPLLPMLPVQRGAMGAAANSGPRLRPYPQPAGTAHTAMAAVSARAHRKKNPASPSESAPREEVDSGVTTAGSLAAYRAPVDRRRNATPLPSDDGGLLAGASSPDGRGGVWSQRVHMWETARQASLHPIPTPEIIPGPPPPLRGPNAATRAVTAKLLPLAAAVQPEAGQMAVLLRKSKQV